MTTLRDKVLALVDAHHGALDTGSYGPTLALAVARMVAEHCAGECDNAGKHLYPGP